MFVIACLFIFTLHSIDHAFMLSLLFTLFVYPSFLFFFFFQAEDGIRYHCVTGVQTCALPISMQPGAALPWDWYEGTIPSNVVIDETAYVETSFSFHLFRSQEPVGVRIGRGEIGRASCRERV